MVADASMEPSSAASARPRGGLRRLALVAAAGLATAAAGGCAPPEAQGGAFVPGTLRSAGMDPPNAEGGGTVLSGGCDAGFRLVGGTEGGGRLGTALAFCTSGGLVAGSAEADHEFELWWSWPRTPAGRDSGVSLERLSSGASGSLAELACGEALVAASFMEGGDAGVYLQSLDGGRRPGERPSIVGSLWALPAASTSVAVVAPPPVDRAARWKGGATLAVSNWDPQGTYWSYTPMAQDAGPGPVRSGDLDGDGLADLVAWWASDRLVVFLGDRDAGFTERTLPFSGLAPHRLAVGRVPRSDAGYVAVLGRDVTGHHLDVFVFTANGLAPRAGTSLTDASPEALALGDWDEDGRVDVFVGVPWSGAVRRFALQEPNAAGGPSWSLVDAGILTPCTLLGGGDGGACFLGGPRDGVTSRFGAALALDPPHDGGDGWLLAVGAPDWSLADDGGTDSQRGAVFFVPGQVVPSQEGARDAGVDGGQPPSDAGTPLDGGSDAASDAGSDAGNGIANDAGAAPDSGLDGGLEPDGGLDAGIAPESPAGPKTYFFGVTGCSTALDAPSLGLQT